MAVVTKYGTGYKDPAALRAINAVFGEGRVRSICSQITLTNGDSATSQYFVGKVPSNAILLRQSSFDAEAIAGNTAFSLGFAGALTALVNALNAAAGSIATTAMSAVTAPNVNKFAWQLAGFTSDPGGTLDIIASTAAAITATATMTFNLQYTK